MSNRQKVSEASRFIAENKEAIKFGLFALAGIILFRQVLSGFSSLFSVGANTKEEAERKAKEQADLIDRDLALEAAKGLTPTYSNSQYRTFADGLYSAMYGGGTEDSDVLRIFYKMRNDPDILKLTDAFGLRRGWPGTWPAQYENLTQWVANDLSNGEVSKLNEHFKKMGMKHRY